MKSVAFATCETMPAMSGDDLLAAEILREHTIAVDAVVWDAPGIEWSRYDCVVIRSAWDYHRRAARYAEWLRRCLAEGVRLWNPAAAVLANMDKRYLTALAARGIGVVPTTFVDAASPIDLAALLRRHSWSDVVVKPAVSASADGTWRTSRATADADQSRFAEQVRSGAVLVQPFLPEITSLGEWSIVFFENHYSHAVVKRPAAGDFRVQQHHGGDTIAADPAPELIEQARAILSHVEHPLLYARVDGIARVGKFLLMELEINEPFLYLAFSRDAPRRFAEAIERLL